MSKTNTSESVASGSSSSNHNGNQQQPMSGVSLVESSIQSNMVSIYRPTRLGSINSSNNTTKNVSPSASPTRPISIPANPNDIFLFKGFLPLDKNSFPSHYMFNCNTLEGVGFLPDQMFQLFAQILAYEYIRKGQTIPNSVMSGLTYFQEICTLRKRRIIPNEILPRERQITTSMGAPLHTMGSTSNVTFTQHISKPKHPGVVSSKPISESPRPIASNPPPPPQTKENTSSSQTPLTGNPPMESNNTDQSEKSSTTTTTETNPVNSTTSKNDENSNSNLVTIDRAQQFTYRVVKPQPNVLETNLTLIGLEACSYLCESFPEGNAKFKELLVTPIVNPHLPMTNNSNHNSSSISSDTTSSSSTISEKQVEKSKENSPKIQKAIEVITLDDETPKKTLPTKKTNNISTTNVTRPSRSKIITTPIRQLELSSSDEESPEVVEDENKKRKRKTITTKRKKKEKKSKKNHLGNDIYTVEKVLRKKIRESSEPEYLVKWQGYGEEDNSWVKESDMLDKALIQNFRGTVEYEKKSK